MFVHLYQNSYSGGGLRLANVVVKGLTRTVYIHYRQVRHENLPLHGSCIILSKLFIDKETILFYPETQFYGEELLLYLRTKRNSYKVVYNPEMLVHHMQGRATKQLGKSKEVNVMRITNLRNAAKAYLEEIGK